LPERDSLVPAYIISQNALADLFWPKAMFTGNAPGTQIVI
jgi:hypothetical protein